MAFFFINPVEIVNQFVVLVIICFVMALMVKYWDRVLVALTGDDRLHGTKLDFIWFFFFKCCGTCTGDWTRCLTLWPCCCCIRRKGINLVHEFGRIIGITTYPVELRGIVCGDLPYDRRGNFYVCVECSANPPQNTAPVEEVIPKVVHFPEVITVRLRWSPLEEPVRITVKELHVFGSRDLCSVHVPAMTILDWAASRECVKRLEMKVLNSEFEHESPPWILMEFGNPVGPAAADERDLENFRGHTNTVRTATRDGHCEDLDVKDFKFKYTLLDQSGHAIQEPLEQDLHSIAWRNHFVRRGMHCLVCGGTLALAAFLIVRFYTASCYREFTAVSMAYQSNHTFPISKYELGKLVHTCHEMLDGTGTPPGVACKPSYEQVMEMCRSPAEGGKYPKEQPQARAYGGAFDWIGLDEFGFHCSANVCRLNHLLEDFDHLTVLTVAAYVIFTVFFRICGNEWVRSRKLNLQRIRTEQTRTMQERIINQNGSRGLFMS